MNLDNVVIVLCRPEESRNVGAVCRAMANNGIHTLRIVGKKEDFDEERVRILAIHAAYIWENAQFFDSITEATSDCVCAAGTTRRRGKKRFKLQLPEEFTSMAESTTVSGGKVAVVFGNERTGLTDDEVDQCTVGVTIPSSPDFASLNLSHAVQIMCYHLFRSNRDNISGCTPVTLERLDGTIKVLADSLQEIGFFSVTGREDMEQFWRTILSRSALSEKEAQYVEHVFTKAAGFTKKRQKD